MTREEAEEYAKVMTYSNAVYNALQGKCIPYRKATLIKLYELLDMIEPKSKGKHICPYSDECTSSCRNVVIGNDDYMKAVRKDCGLYE